MTLSVDCQEEVESFRNNWKQLSRLLEPPKNLIFINSQFNSQHCHSQSGSIYSNYWKEKKKKKESPKKVANPNYHIFFSYKVQH